MVITSMLPILQNHIERYAGFSAQDAYKLLHQRHFGPGHQNNDDEVLIRQFQEEFNRIEPDDRISMIETLAPDFSIVRVNLMPFKARKLNHENLCKAYIDSFKYKMGNMNEFLQDWQDLMQTVKQGILNISLSEMEEVDRIAKKYNYAAMHHSEQYARLNAPSYRVFKLSILLSYFPDFENELPLKSISDEPG